MKIKPVLLGLLMPLLSVSSSFAETPLVVEAVKAHLEPVKREVQLTGEVVAKNTLTVSFSASGRVTTVEVQEGDRVPAGTVLARMDPVQQQQELRAAQAGVATAKADYDQAVEDSTRLEKLFKSGATTRITRDDAVDAVQLAEGALAQAQADLDRSQKAVRDTVLVAPTDAIVTSRLVEPGQVVGAAQPVIKLALGDPIDVVFKVPEVLLTATPKTTKFELSSINDPRIKFSGAPREVSPLIDSKTGTVEVTVGVAKRPAGLKYGDAILGKVLQVESKSTVLPYSAMSVTLEGPAVWVIDPKTMSVSLQQITIDRFETGRIVLKDPLPEGTMVVTNGAQLLFPGRVVKLYEGSKQ